DILHHLFCLLLDIIRNDIPFEREGDLSGGVEHVSDFYSVAVWSECFRCIFRINRFHSIKSPSHFKIHAFVTFLQYTSDNCLPPPGKTGGIQQSPSPTEGQRTQSKDEA